MVIVLNAHEAVTPAGKPVGIPIPVLPVVAIVTRGKIPFTQIVGVDDDVSAKQRDLSLYMAYLPLEMRTGLNVVDVSSTKVLTLDAPPTKEFNPVLPSEFPANNFTMPLGALASPLPVITISPPVSVLIFILLPAFKTMAPL